MASAIVGNLINTNLPLKNIFSLERFQMSNQSFFLRFASNRYGCSH